MSRRVDQIAKAVVTDTCAVWNVLSSGALHNACVANGFEFVLTDFVLYECLSKPRSRLKPSDSELRKRLTTARGQSQFKSYSLSLDDLQEVAILEQRQRLSKGELSAIAFARKVNLGFQTDDQGARKLAVSALATDRIQTTPHVLGWLFFEGHLIDGDLDGIISEHESLDGPLRPHFKDMHLEAMRCRLLAKPPIEP